MGTECVLTSAYIDRSSRSSYTVSLSIALFFFLFLTVSGSSRGNTVEIRAGILSLDGDGSARVRFLIHLWYNASIRWLGRYVGMESAYIIDSDGSEMTSSIALSRAKPSPRSKFVVEVASNGVLCVCLVDNPGELFRVATLPQEPRRSSLHLACTFQRDKL